YDGQTLATTSDDSTLRLWNVATQQELLSFQRLGRSMSRLLFSPDNRAIVVSETQLSRMRGLRFFQAPSFEEIGSVAQPERKD
ncbi:MAG: hypothetical protein V4710_08970, partial [Verrucomicrobiota bacterium]